ncbi:protein AATF [Chrysoperla carnea]|uniref:protein AATF n=1 Tax=Chrysoperla carnea TaxID=189513 RepID=UPI001D06EB9E|nr:protein AATF [Chrysoperla carnea]
MIRKKTQTLSDKISNVLNTAPGVIDPEDDIYEDTRAKVVSNEDIEDEDQIGDFKPSKITKQNLELLENIDTRYAGKRRSRKDFEDSDENIPDEQSDDSEVSEEDNSNIENEEDSSVDDEDESDEGEDFGEENDESREENSNFKHMREENINSQVQKGQCVKNQLRLWENLLEVRIKLQKCLITANRLPQTDTYTKIKEKSGEEFEKLAKETQSNVAKVLDGLLNLQDTLLKKYPETKNLDQKTVEESDEEIPSDDEDEEKIVSENEEETGEPITKKVKTLPDYEQTISKRHNTYRNYRNNVIRKWNEKTRISVSKNLINTNSVINQIEYILKDREKYIRKTQLKRSNYNIVGLKSVKSTGSDDENDETTSRKRTYEEYNAEIYDDDDFYHQLLRELIEYKSTNITDPIKLSQQWIQLQSMRSKMKRNVDTKATKGRKIRYTVHTKLVNFLAPMDENKWTDHAKTELYNSLFGKNLPK